MKEFVAWLDYIFRIQTFIEKRKWKWVHREEGLREYLGYCKHGCQNCYKIKCSVREKDKKKRSEIK